MSREGKTGGAIFVKSQASSRISLMISLSKVGAISPRALGTAGSNRMETERLRISPITLAGHGVAPDTSLVLQAEEMSWGIRILMGTRSIMVPLVSCWVHHLLFGTLLLQAHHPLLIFSSLYVLTLWSPYSKCARGNTSPIMPPPNVKLGQR